MSSWIHESPRYAQLIVKLNHPNGCDQLLFWCNSYPGVRILLVFNLGCHSLWSPSLAGCIGYNQFLLCHMFMLPLLYKAKRTCSKLVGISGSDILTDAVCILHEYVNKTCEHINTSDMYVNIYLEKHTGEMTANIYIHGILTDDFYIPVFCAGWYFFWSSSCSCH